MFLLLIKKYWFEVVEVAVIVLLFLAMLYYKNEADRLQSKVNEKQAYITAQNMIIQNNRVDYETRIKRLPTVLHDINTKYKTEVITVEKWRDQNETHDCNSSMQYLNTYQF